MWSFSCKGPIDLFFFPLARSLCYVLCQFPIVCLFKAFQTCGNLFLKCSVSLWCLYLLGVSWSEIYVARLVVFCGVSIRLFDFGRFKLGSNCMVLLSGVRGIPPESCYLFFNEINFRPHRSCVSRRTWFDCVICARVFLSDLFCSCNDLIICDSLKIVSWSDLDGKGGGAIIAWLLLKFDDYPVGQFYLSDNCLSLSSFPSESLIDAIVSTSKDDV